MPDIIATTAISRVFYDALARELDIVFASNLHYRYFDVPAATYRQLVDAPSKRSFFNACIRDRFLFEEIRAHRRTFDPMRASFRR